MKKLLYITIAAAAVTMAAGCTADDIWDSFPKSDNEFIKSLNDDSAITDHYYPMVNCVRYNSYDSINWEKRGAPLLGDYPLASDNI